MTKKSINYSRKNVYVGIDVHKKSYILTAICERQVIKKEAIIAQPDTLVSYLKKYFKGARIYSVYEAGFSGFVLHRKLVASGVKNIVVNPASLEVAVNDRVKTDRKDSRKLAEHLYLGRLQGIYIPTEKEELSRLLHRTREQIVRTRVRVANQIKSRMFQFGLMDPNDDNEVSKKYLNGLKKLDIPSELAISLKILSDEWLFLSDQITNIEKLMKQQAKKDHRLEEVYRSVPGVGIISARTLANELGDLSRFPNEKALFSYVGFTPTEYSSGEKDRKGHITRQGPARLRWILTELSWRAIRKDEALHTIYTRIAHHRGGKRAIVGVGRRLIGRIRSCFQNNCLYKVGIYERNSIISSSK